MNKNYNSSLLRINELLWKPLLSITLSLFVFLNYFPRLGHCPLTNFHDRPIGVGVLAGVDAIERTWVYVITMIVFLTICTATYLGLAWLDTFIQRNIRQVQVYVQLEKSLLSILSSLTAVTLLLAILTASEFLLNISKILLFYIVLTLLFFYLKILTFYFKQYFLINCQNNANIGSRLTWLNTFIRRIIHPVYLQVEKSMLFTLSSFTAVTLIFALLTANGFLVNISKILLAFIGLMYLQIFFKILSFHRKQIFVKCYRNNTVIVFGFTLIFVLFLVKWIVLDQAFIFAFPDFVSFFIMVIVFLLVYPTTLHKLSLDSKNVNAALIVAGMPLALIPFSIPLSNELQFTLSGRWDISPRILALLAIGFLMILSVIGFVVSIRRAKPCRRPSRIIGYWYFPAFLASIYLFKAYKHAVIFLKPFDLNHQAEPTVPIQQFFSFGALPFVDIMPTHGISDIFSSMLYSLVNGYRGLEMLLWDWLVGLIALLLLYSMLARLFSPLFSLCVMLLLPIETIFSSYYAMFLLPGLLLFWVMKNPNIFRYVMLWISVLWVFGWRSDFGVAAIVSCVFVTPGVYAYHKEHHPKWSWTRGLIMPIVILCGVFAMAVIVYSVLIQLRGRSAIEVLAQFQHFGKDLLQTHSYVSIFQGFSPLVSWQYIGVPLVSMAYMIYFAVRVCAKNVHLSRAQVILTSLAAFSLAMSVRSIHRHSLIEGYNQYLATFLLCLSPLYFWHIKRRFSEILFLSIIVTYFFAYYQQVPIRYSSILTQYSQQDHLFSFRYWRNKPDLVTVTNQFQFSQPDHLFSFRYWHNKPDRVTITDQSQYANLVEFFNASMSKEQTFLDFTSAPMLYVFTDRQCPAYYHQIINYTTDSAQRYLLKLLKPFHQAGRLPFVIFKQGNGWDHLDGVPQELRSYRIAEFIYQHYRPFVMVDNYEIWKERNLLSKQATEISMPLAFQTVDHFELNDMTVIESTDKQIVMHTGKVDPGIWNVLDIPAGIHFDKTKSYRLRVSYTSSVTGPMQVFYMFDDKPFNEEESRRVTVSHTDTMTSCLIEIPTKTTTEWLRNIRIDPPSNAVFAIQQVELVYSENGGWPIDKRSPQQLDLQQLPYLWGMYDEQGAAQATAVLDTVMLPSTNIEPNQPIELSISPTIDKTTGNYLHFKIRSNENGTVTLRYGTGLANNITFDVVASPNELDYLVRISMQWAWMSQEIATIQLEASTPLQITQIFIRKGD